MSVNEGRLTLSRRDSIAQIGYINDDIMIDILSRLPVQTVASCKLVAKHWLRLTLEPNFPKLQLTWSRKNPKYIVCPYPINNEIPTHLSLMDQNGITIQDIPLPDFEYSGTPDITCFFNGLVCSVDPDRSGDVNIRIFNAITLEVIVLPKGTPSEAPPMVGIIFHPETNDFKAFCFFSDSSEEGDEDGDYKCEVYAPGSTAWRLISEKTNYPDYHPFCDYGPRYVSVVGSMYWFVWSEDERGGPLYILSVDMDENFTMIDLPAELDRWSFLIELEGCLSLVYIEYLDNDEEREGEDRKLYVEVYKLIERDWVRRAKVVLDPMDIGDVDSVAAINSEIFIIFELSDESFYCLVYDLEEQNLRTLDIDDNFGGHTPVAFPFAESLLECSGG